MEDPPNTPRQDVPAKLARALADPVRIGILTVLRDGPLSERAISNRLGVDARTVARHGRELSELGYIRQRGPTRLYELLPTIEFSDEIWEQLPAPVKQASLTASLAQIYATMSAAVGAGGFDRRDMHLTRTSLRLDEEGWKAVARDMLALRSRLEEAHAEAAERLAEEPGGLDVPGQAVLMLFSSSGPPVDSPDHDDPPPFSVDEGLGRAYDLQDAIGKALFESNPDWGAILDRLDELRVVLRATAAETSPAADQAELPR